MKSLLVIIFISISTPTLSCTTLLIAPRNHGYVAKNLDWYNGKGFAFVNGSGVKKTAAFISNSEHPLIWESHYMSVTLSHKGIEFPTEGMNEMGLSTDIMNLDESKYPTPNNPKPAVVTNQWMQYILDTSANVDEAIQKAINIRIVGSSGNNHFMVCDSSPKCAVFEYLDGVLVIYQNKELPISALSNSTYDKSILNLKKMQLLKSEDAILADKSSNSLMRFARASIWSRRSLTDQSANTDPVSYGFSALKDISRLDTQWSIVFDLMEKVIYFKTKDVDSIRSVDLKKLSKNCAINALFIDMNIKNSGDITNQFSTYDNVTAIALARSNSKTSIKTQNAYVKYRAENTSCKTSN